MRRRRLAAALTLALIAPARDATAGSITQTVAFRLATHGTSFQPYARFDPALGPLTEVDLSISGTVTSAGFDFRNSGAMPIDFDGSVGLQFLAAGEPVVLSSTFRETLLPAATDAGRVASGTFAATISYPASGGSLAAWIGTGTLGPDVAANLATGSSVACSDPGIVVTPDGPGAVITGTETVTYVFGPSVPEPASWVMMAVGMGAVAGVEWVRRGR